MPCRARTITAEAAAMLAFASLTLPGCGGGDDPTGAGRESRLERAEAGRIAARPDPSAAGGRSAGVRPIGGDPGNGYVYVPASQHAGRPAPLVLTLHGAGGDATGAVRRLVPYAEEAGAIIVAPKSRGNTWDALLGGYGPDVAFIDRVLEQVFDRYSVDPARVGVQGFSDGASYALAIGVRNGELFRHVVAFSPGFLDDGDARGSPRFFITHGVDDPILPIDATSREIVPGLRAGGYAVTYREFDGKHEVPDDLVPEALSWLEADAASRADVRRWKSD